MNRRELIYSDLVHRLLGERLIVKRLQHCSIQWMVWVRDSEGFGCFQMLLGSRIGRLACDEASPALDLLSQRTRNPQQLAKLGGQVATSNKCIATSNNKQVLARRHLNNPQDKRLMYRQMMPSTDTGLGLSNCASMRPTVRPLEERYRPKAIGFESPYSNTHPFDLERFQPLERVLTSIRPSL